MVAPIAAAAAQHAPPPLINATATVNQAPPATVTTTTTTMDNYIPRIPEVHAEDIQTKFPHPTLPKIDEEPTYEAIFELQEQANQNALAIESPFGGGQHGHWGTIVDVAIFEISAGVEWAVPTSGGASPTFAKGALDDDKKLAIAEFIVNKKGIKTSTVVERLISKQVRDVIDPEYYMELRHPIFQYSKVATLKTINHILTHYVIVNDQLMEENAATFAEPPYLSKPINVYYLPIYIPC